ncbi:MAG: hypothetical protein ACKOUM_09490 [Sphingopyxis sp.]
MNLPLFLLILASVSLSAIAQTCLKIGVGAARGAADMGAAASGAASGTASGAVAIMVQYAMSPFVILGLALYGFGTLLWLFVLARLPLTAAYPFVGMGFIITMVIGATALGEHLSIMRMAGAVLIALGCVLVARSVG